MKCLVAIVVVIAAVAFTVNCRDVPGHPEGSKKGQQQLEETARTTLELHQKEKSEDHKDELRSFGATYNSNSGTIRHPSSGSYTNNEDYIWIIRATSPINITFTSFNTESGYDRLRVRDGSTSGSTSIGIFSGSSLPVSSVITSGNTAYLRFTSDSSVIRTGFQLSWKVLIPTTTSAPTTTTAVPTTISAPTTSTADLTSTIAVQTTTVAGAGGSLNQLINNVDSMMENLAKHLNDVKANLTSLIRNQCDEATTTKVPTEATTKEVPAEATTTEVPTEATTTEVPTEAPTTETPTTTPTEPLTTTPPTQGCPVEAGYMLIPGSLQCMKMFNMTRRSWSDANKKCQSHGLVLAETEDPVALRSYLVTTQGVSGYPTWLGGKGDNSNMRWSSDNTIIPNNSGYWHYYKAYSTYCLQIMTQQRWLTAFPATPFWANSCTATRWTLCELV